MVGFCLPFGNVVTLQYPYRYRDYWLVSFVDPSLFDIPNSSRIILTTLRTAPTILRTAIATVPGSPIAAITTSLYLLKSHNFQHLQRLLLLTLFLVLPLQLLESLQELLVSLGAKRQNGVALIAGTTMTTPTTTAGQSMAITTRTRPAAIPSHADSLSHFQMVRPLLQLLPGLLPLPQLAARQYLHLNGFIQLYPPSGEEDSLHKGLALYRQGVGALRMNAPP